VKGSEFSIKRTVNQTGGSKYEINNRETTQADVVTVLKSKGIDLDNNRFLILQGLKDFLQQY
jgi:structural maintenance of chromosome 4